MTLNLTSNETETWFEHLLCHPVRKSGLVYCFQGPQRGEINDVMDISEDIYRYIFDNYCIECHY